VYSFFKHENSGGKGVGKKHFRKERKNVVTKKKQYNNDGRDILCIGTIYIMFIIIYLLVRVLWAKHCSDGP